MNDFFFPIVDYDVTPACAKRVIVVFSIVGKDWLLPRPCVPSFKRFFFWHLVPVRQFEEKKKCNCTEKEMR
jgi:hypothetical protein